MVTPKFAEIQRLADHGHKLRPPFCCLPPRSQGHAQVWKGPGNECDPRSGPHNFAAKNWIVRSAILHSGKSHISLVDPKICVEGWGRLSNMAEYNKQHNASRSRFWKSFIHGTLVRDPYSDTACLNTVEPSVIFKAISTEEKHLHS